MMGLQPPYVPLGPYHLEDVMGYGVAAQFLVGLPCRRCQGAKLLSVRDDSEIHPAFSNAFNASAHSRTHHSGNKKLHVKITRCHE